MTEIRIQEQTARDIVAGIANNYRYALAPFRRFIEDRPFTLETIAEYFAAINSEGLKPGTILHRRCAVRHALRRVTATDPEAAVRMDAALKLIEAENRPPRIQAESKRRKAFTRIECEKLIQNARSERQRVFIRFLWNSGLRISEMLSIEHKHIKQAGPDRVTVFILGKGRKQRTITLPAQLIEDVRRVFTGRESPYLFHTTTGRRYSRCYVSRQIGKLSEFVLKQRFTAHSLRHSCATDLLERGAAIEAVSEFLGHSSPSITLSFYSHRTLSDAEILARCV